MKNVRIAQNSGVRTILHVGSTSSSVAASSSASLWIGARGVVFLVVATMLTSESSVMALVVIRGIRAKLSNVALLTTIETLQHLKVIVSILVSMMEVILFSGTIVVIMSLMAPVHEIPPTIVVILVEAVHMAATHTAATFSITVIITSTSSLVVVSSMVFLAAAHALFHISSIASLIVILALSTMIGIILSLLRICWTVTSA